MEEIILLDECSDSLFEVIYAIYEKSFPKNEQKTKESFKKIFNNNDYRVFVIQKNGDIEGFCLFFAPQDLNFMLLEYMAMNTQMRSLGMGSKLFGFSVNTLFFQEQDKPILIEIDSTKKKSENSIVNQKRADFYRKNGCKTIQDFEYILGLKTQLVPPLMEMLIYGNKEEFILKSQLKQYVQDIYERVYNNERNHANIEKMLAHLNEKIILI